jgi:hypothetical protein
MPTTSTQFDWKNPYHRFGYIDVDFMIGKWSQDDAAMDAFIFFGPLTYHDHIKQTTDPVLPRLLSQIGLFSSTKEAERRGFRGLVPYGYSELRIKQWGRVHLICFLRPIEEE